MHGQINTTKILQQMAISAWLITAAGKLKTLKKTSHRCPLISRTVYYTQKITKYLACKGGENKPKQK